MQTEYKATVGENGRLIIPAKVRDHFGIGSGDQILLVIEEQLKIIPVKDKIKEFQALLKARNIDNISLVDSLLETRNQEKAYE